jgi:type II secretory pathway pseudopilin PulG
MEIHTLNNKGNKGISLVELTVAMGILTMVFAGTVTLIIMVVNLSFNTGTKTVAIALAQRELTNKITAFRANPDPNAPCTILNDISVPKVPSGISELRACISPAPIDINGSTNFVLITSTATWKAKGDPSDSLYQMAQMLRKSYQ